MQVVCFFLAVFLSGAAGLMYQSLWIRHLAFVFGNTTMSVSLVVSSFFFGLAAGSYVLGKRVDRAKSPLRFYGFLQAGVAVSALLVYLLLTRMDTVYVFLYRDVFPNNLFVVNTAKLVLSFALFFVPTFLMGGTLPAIAKSYSKSRETFAFSLGIVYAVNTIGAFAGLMLMSFVVIELLGLRMSYGVALLLSILAGGLAFAASQDSPETVSQVRAEEGVGVSRRSLPFYLLAFVLGVIGMAYEVLWVRLWSFISLHSDKTPVGMAPAELSCTYVYSMILGLLLIGISVGGALVRSFHRRGGNALKKIALIEFSIGTYTLVTLIVERHLMFDGVTAKLVEMACIVLPTTILMGVAFPLLGSVFVDSLKTSGRQFGGFYAANTLGASVGPILAGMVILPAFGTYASLMLLAVCNLTISLVVSIVSTAKEESSALVRRRIIPGAAIVGTVMVVLLFQPSPTHPIMAEATIVFENDNQVAHTMLLEYPGGYRRMIANNYSVSGLSTLNLFGRKSIQIPAALRGREPEDILVLCVGAGGSWRATIKYPEASVVAVDINPAVFQFMHLIQPPDVYAEMTRPGMRPVIADARNYLLLDDHKYDIINIDPSPPISQPGMVNLHTLEFYQLVKNRLKPDGVLYQRLSCNIESEFVYRALLKPIVEVFEHVTVWSLLSSGIDIMASDEPLDTLRADPRLIDDEVLEGLDDLFLIGCDELEGYVEGVPPVTDDRPLIEYYLLRSWGWLSSTDPWEDVARNRDHLLSLKQPMDKYITVVTD